MLKIGIIPWSIGTEISDIGMVAISAIISVITNSKGCISPTWRLPINLIANKINRYIIIDLTNILTIILLVCLRFAFNIYLTDKLLRRILSFFVNLGLAYPQKIERLFGCCILNKIWKTYFTRFKICKNFYRN